MDVIEQQELADELCEYAAEHPDENALFVISGRRSDNFELPDELYGDEREEITAQLVSGIKQQAPEFIGLVVHARQGLLHPASRKLHRMVACFARGQEPQFRLSTPGGFAPCSAEVAELNAGALTVFQQAFDEDAREKIRASQRQIASQLEQLETSQLEQLFDTVLLTMAARQSRETPAAYAERLADEWEDDAEQLARYQQLLRAEITDLDRDAASNKIPLFDPDDAEFSLARHDADTLVELALHSGCLLAERHGGSFLEEISRFGAAYQTWQDGQAEQLHELTMRVWSAARENQLEDQIAEHGFSVTYILAEVPWAYTTGLQKTYDHPELLIYGLSQQASYGILAQLAEAIAAGRRFAGGTVDGADIFMLPLGFLTIPPDEYPNRLNVALSFYGDYRFDALQVVACDANGLFPWQEGCDANFIAAQPLLGEPPAVS